MYLDGYRRLYNILVDLIKEQQAKLGYRKEMVRLYYPMDSLNNILGTKLSEDALLSALSDIPDYVRNSLGDIEYTSDGGRFCITIPEKGSEYVHNSIKDNEFITKLIETVSRHGCSMEDIYRLFLDSWEKVERRDIKDGDFDCYIRFVDRPDDEYYYCFKDEGCHIIYHRFLPEDFREL